MQTSLNSHCAGAVFKPFHENSIVIMETVSFTSANKVGIVRTVIFIPPHDEAKITPRWYRSAFDRTDYFRTFKSSIQPGRQFSIKRGKRQRHGHSVRGWRCRSGRRFNSFL